jgi:hypothetical protein
MSALEEYVIDKEPENLTQNDCVILSNERIKKKYVKKWGSTGSCDA